MPLDEDVVVVVLEEDEELPPSCAITPMLLSRIIAVSSPERKRVIMFMFM